MKTVFEAKEFGRKKSEKPWKQWKDKVWTAVERSGIKWQKIDATAVHRQKWREICKLMPPNLSLGIS